MAHVQRTPLSPAIVHFEVSIESLRQALVAAETDSHIRVVDGHTGDVIIDGDRVQQPGGDLGNPGDETFVGEDLTRGGVDRPRGRPRQHGPPAARSHAGREQREPLDRDRVRARASPRDWPRL